MASKIQAQPSRPIRDVPGAMFDFTHEAAGYREARFAPLITEQLRSRRRSKAGRSWDTGETYVRVGGKCCYLYRAVERDGNLVDSMLSEHRDTYSTKKFFFQADSVYLGGKLK
ncbi:MAG: DDE-type integrase/transposase/recombinase [Chloroflexota bacterium]|nr:DDE-type integrase/transposase/recombinase [Chloroflexota bacterium]